LPRSINLPGSGPIRGRPLFDTARVACIGVWRVQE
jgi:hypothetical protein